MIEVPSICGRSTVMIDPYDLIQYDSFDGPCCNECWSIRECREAWREWWDIAT